jgi:putative protease
MADENQEQAEGKEKEIQDEQIGEVTNYFEHVGAAAIKLDKPLKVGDTIRIVGGDVDFEQEVESMQIDRKDVQEAKEGDEIGVMVKEKVRDGYRVYKK